MTVCLYSPPITTRPDAAELLRWAGDVLDDLTATAVEIRLAGVATRMALEYHLGALCREVGPPRGDKWHSFAIRLLKCGAFTMADYRHVRRLSRLAAKAVHGKPWDRERAWRLWESVEAFVAENGSGTELAG